MDDIRSHRVTFRSKLSLHNAPWVQLDVRYPVQLWKQMVVKPAAHNMAWSNRSQMAPDAQSDQVPIPVSCSGVTCSSRRSEGWEDDSTVALLYSRVTVRPMPSRHTA
jgi:hypothetical protein